MSVHVAAPDYKYMCTAPHESTCLRLLCLSLFRQLCLDVWSFGSGNGAHFYGKHSGVIYCYDADGCDDGGGDSESSIG